jgi:nucleotide-binding universal stress UspA family protein
VIELKKLLVPTDFSLTSLKAMRYAIELAKHFGGTIVLMHVVERPTFAPSFRSTGTAATELDAQARAWAEGELDKMIKNEVPSGVEVKTMLRGGSAAPQIIAVAKELDVDLVVMGTAGQGFQQHLFMGSVAEKVVRKAPCAVLTVRQEEKDFVVPWGEGSKPTM